MYRIFGLVLGECIEFLHWICLPGALFCSSVCPFISMHTNVTWYPGENDAIILGKSVHFVYESSDERSRCIFVL